MSSHHRMKRFNVLSENRSFGTVVFEWLMERKRPLITVLLLVVLSFGTISFLSSKKSKMEKRSFAAYSAVNVSDSVALKSFVETYHNTTAGRLATLALAKLSFDNGNYDEVEQLLAPMIGSGRQSPELGRILAMEMLAKAHEARGNFEKAEKLYSKLSSIKSNPFKEEHRLALATTLEKSGKVDEAKKIYEAMSAPTYESAELRSKANERLIQLAAAH